MNSKKPEFDLIRVLIVDDVKTIQESIKLFLDTEPDIEVVGTANDGYSAIKQAQCLKPDVVLMDIEMPYLDGITATKLICQQFKNIKVIMLTICDGDNWITTSLDAGAKNYLLKNNMSEHKVKDTIRSVYKEQTQDIVLRTKRDLLATTYASPKALKDSQEINLDSSSSQIRAKAIDEFKETILPNKKNSGIKLIAWSGVLTIACLTGGGFYTWISHKPSKALAVRLIPVEKNSVEDIINKTGTVNLGKQQILKSPVDGTVQQVLVSTDDRVKSGQTLITLLDSEEEDYLLNNLQQLEIQKQELELARSRQAALKASEKLQFAQQELQALGKEEERKLKLELARNRKKVIEYSKKLQDDRVQLEELEVLVQQGVISKNHFREQKDQVLNSQSQLQDAELAVDTATIELQSLEMQHQSKERSLLDQVQTAASELRDAELAVSSNIRELERLKVELKKIEQQIQNNIVKATVDGKVLNIKVKPGDVVQLGNPLLILGDPAQQIVQIKLAPIDAKRVSVNQIARISVIGAEAEKFTGRVQSVSKLAEGNITNGQSLAEGNITNEQSQAMVTATIKLDRPSQKIIPGSMVDVEIIVDRRQEVVVLETDIIQNSGSGFFVWIRDSQGKAKKRPVTLGLEGLTTVEVKSGLSPGDQVVLPPSSSSLEPGQSIKPKK